MQKRDLLRLPILGRAALFGIRWSRCRSQLIPQRRAIWKWLFKSREYTNYTYHLSSINRQHFIAATALVTGLEESVISSFFDEIENDTELQRHHFGLVKAHNDGQFADCDVRFGRRAAWYAVVRALHPRCVVETGVDKGLGALAICSALRRNQKEGHLGKYIGLDINSAAGWLLSGPYASHGSVVIGDSITSLRSLSDPIDLFINDSDHSPSYEMAEYECIASLLSPYSVIIGDNVAETDCLHRFSRKHKRSFIACQEVPADHWFPGGAMGFSWVKP